MFIVQATEKLAKSHSANSLQWKNAIGHFLTARICSFDSLAK
jgi:hypothetical protein